jgi:hypothetical protein
VAARCGYRQKVQVDPAVGLDFSLLNALEAGALTFGKMWQRL